ncbi:hypothetical protein AAC387_Pa08g0901 [Persea americana]
MDAYVHNASEWKIDHGDGGIDWCAPYHGYRYGVDNQSTMAGRKRPDLPRLPTSSIARPSQTAPSSAGEGRLRKRKVSASKVIGATSSVKKSRWGASHRGIDKSVPSGSRVAPSSPIAIPLPPTGEVIVTLIEDFASDEGMTIVATSLVCRRKIDFVDEPYVPEAPRFPVQEEMR